jgi:hypothetical protein
MMCPCVCVCVRACVYACMRVCGWWVGGCECTRHIDLCSPLTGNKALGIYSAVSRTHTLQCLICIITPCSTLKF